MLRPIKSKNFSYSKIFNQQQLQTYAESHHSIFGAEVCVDEDTYCTPCFHGRTGYSTFTNVKKGFTCATHPSRSDAADFFYAFFSWCCTSTIFCILLKFTLMVTIHVTLQHYGFLSMAIKTLYLVSTTIYSGESSLQRRLPCLVIIFKTNIIIVGVPTRVKSPFRTLISFSFS